MTFIVVGCLDEGRENEHAVLIMLYDELYYIPETVDESEYTLKEMFGTITSTEIAEDPPKENFSSNSLNNLDVYTVEEKNNIFVIPYQTDRYGTRYYVLEKFNSRNKSKKLNVITNLYP